MKQFFIFLLPMALFLGCVSRQSQSATPTPDCSVKLTSEVPAEFKNYDAAFIQAVTQRWYDLLQGTKFKRNRSGKVVLKFCLHSDGRITGLKVVENDVGELLAYICQKAILDSAPYPHFSEAMLQKIGQDYRIMTFTFNYS